MRGFQIAAGAFLATSLVWCGQAAEGFYHVGRQGDRWTVLDPSEHSLRLLGVDQVRWDGMPCELLGWRRPYEEHNRATYPSRRAWEDETLSRLKAWGFNMLGACSDDALRHRGLPHAIFLNLSEPFCTGDKSRWRSEFKGVPNTAMPNVFHPDFPAHCDRRAKELCAPHRNDPDLLGYFIDNELVWQSAEDPASAAERYFQLTTEAIRRHDPNHLILGCRFAGLDGAPESVWRAAGRYCDVITFNCYPWADLDRNIVLDAKGGRPLTARFADVHRMTGKPLLITEWSFPAIDTGRPCLNGAGQRVNTQRERAAATDLFARTMLALPYVLGYSYFMWLDQPALGTNGEHPEDCNYGLVSETGVPYEQLVQVFTSVHREANDSSGLLAMPAARTPPRTERRPSVAESFRTAAQGDSKGIRFERNGHAWILSNAKELVLAGLDDGTNMIESIRCGGFNFGRYDGMVQLLSENGTSHWIPGDSIHGASYATDGPLGVLLVTARGHGAGLAVEMTHRVTLAPQGTDFLCEIVRIRNVGSESFVLRRLYLCPIADAERPSVRKGVPNLWNGPRECHWTMSGERSYGMVSSDPSAEWFNLWIDENGQQHPDIDFLPNGEIRLCPGDTYEPEAPMGARAVLGLPTATMPS